MIGHQSRMSSFLEAAANVLIGLLVAMLVQAGVYPLLGIRSTLSQDAAVALAFTVASLLRSYLIRRIFIAVEANAERQEQQRAASLARRLATGGR